ncbi:MAG: PD-(D/E)XK nuclease family transposase [Prevotella sp.]|nr:PD-(D/E)XK nuclease family transposase [Prevotella sp.]
MCHSALQERYVNFYTDFAFKKLFGTEANKDLLISFLNSLFDGTEVIKTLNYLNVEHLGHNAAERKAVFDVYCENEKGEKFLIEMQKAEQEYFKDRSIFYSTFPVQEQAPQGRWNFKLNKVYTIGILNFCIDEGNADYMRREVKLMDTHTKEVFYDKLTYIYLEMPKFRKTEQELVSSIATTCEATGKAKRTFGTCVPSQRLQRKKDAPKDWQKEWKKDALKAKLNLSRPCTPTV